MRFWVRGKGELLAVANEFFYGGRTSRMKEWSFALAGDWTQRGFQFQPPADCSSWHLDLTPRGPADLWLDEVFVGHPDLRSIALPPEKPVGKDEHTLLYLPFEAPLDDYQYFIKG